MLGLTCLAGLMLFALGTSASGSTKRGAETFEPRVTVTIIGKGHVTSMPSGIDCPHACSVLFDPYAEVLLKSHASAGWKFAGWSGDCDDDPCSLFIEIDKNVTARFIEKDQAPPPETPTPPTTTTTTTATTTTTTTTAATTTTTTTPPPPLPPLPPPGKENVYPSGGVLIKKDGKFVPLTNPEQVPFGTEIDATHGKVRVTSADGSTAVFYEGRFLILQGTDAGPPRKKLIVIVLTGGNFKNCGKTRTTAGAGAKPKPPASKRHVWGDAKGSFRTRGKYASATVRGTLWRTDDFCHSTLVAVKRGRVDVYDFFKRKHFLVPAGHSHLARP